MTLPVFYYPQQINNHTSIQLEGDTAKHLHVLRTQVGERLQLTDGKGTMATAVVANAGKKNYEVEISEVTFIERPATNFHLAVSFTKNASRNEWLLEKATELGVATIHPIMSKRTERIHFKAERWNHILVSAMLQSQQVYLPVLDEPKSFDALIKEYQSTQQKLIAHCEAGIERQSLSRVLKAHNDAVFFIGPEGDFTQDEIDFAMQHDFAGIQLGDTRLRTETAAMTVCAYFKMLNS